MTFNRRNFLRTAAAAAVVSTAEAATQIIDTHIHLYDPARPQGVPWPPKNDAILYRPTLPERFSAMSSPLGVSGAVVVEASAWLEDNQWVLDLARDHNVIVGLVGHLEPGKDEFRQHLARFAKNPLFRGIRLGGTPIAAGLAKPAFIDDLRRLEGAGLMLDAIGSASMISPLLTLSDRIPQLRIAVDHMPGEPTGWQSREDTRTALRELAGRRRVYGKISGVLQSVNGTVSERAAAYRGALDEMWEMFGENRVMYGSNWPVSDRLASYKTVLGVMQEYVAGKSATASAKFFAGNARDCYGWIDRG
jgi:predicted TIM-barrel fold metal-dependent hydrolase